MRTVPFWVARAAHPWRCVSPCTLRPPCVCCSVLGGGSDPTPAQTPTQWQRQKEGVLVQPRPPPTTPHSQHCWTSSKDGVFGKTGSRLWSGALGSGRRRLASWHPSDWEGVVLLGRRAPTVHPAHA